MTAVPGEGAPRPRPQPAIDRRALQPYLRVQVKYDRRMLALLRSTLEDTNKQLRRLMGRSGIGAAVRRDQLQQTKVAIFQNLAEFWRQAGNLVRAGRYEAAAAAADSIAIYDKVLFTAVGEGRRYDELLKGLRQNAINAIDLGATRLETSAVELSHNVYNSESISTGQLDRLLNSLLARGSSAREIASEVRGFINPNVPGGVSYSALRLGRTELNNAFHASQARLMSIQPWVEASQWNLSGSHPQPDACDDYAANTDYNGNSGQYAASDIPPNPHPQCLCFLTPVLMSQDDFMGKLMDGAFDNFMDSLG